MHWFENEEFWRELYPYMFPAARRAAAAGEVDNVLALTHVAGGSALDLACGPGRHSVALAQRGFQVTGVDRSEFLLERARERAAETGATVEWVRQDMREFRRRNAFDLACSMFTSFGYFDTEDEDIQVLRNMHASLRPGGTLFLDVISKEKVARNWLNAMCTDFEDGTSLLQRPHVTADWTRIRNQWILLRDGRYRTFEFEHTIYSGRELRDRILRAGFGDVQLFGDLQGAPYGVDAARLIVVARKAA